MATQGFDIWDVDSDNLNNLAFGGTMTSVISPATNYPFLGFFDSSMNKITWLTQLSYSGTSMGALQFNSNQTFISFVIQTPMMFGFVSVSNGAIKAIGQIKGGTLDVSLEYKSIYLTDNGYLFLNYRSSTNGWIGMNTPQSS